MVSHERDRGAGITPVSGLDQTTKDRRRAQEMLAERVYRAGGVATAVIDGRRIVAVSEELLDEGALDEAVFQGEMTTRLSRPRPNGASEVVYLFDLYEAPS